MSQIHEIAKRKLSQKKVETEFFWIKMVLLIFTAIIEAPKYSFKYFYFFSFLKVCLDLNKYLESTQNLTTLV